jgi:DinB superfamily
VDSEQQAFLLTHLKQSQIAFEDALHDCDDSDWSTEVTPGTWSIAHCAEHIVIVESLTVGRLQKIREMPEEAFDEADSARKDAIILRSVPVADTKVSAPERARPVSRYGSRQSALKDFYENHQVFCNLVQENEPWLRGRFTEHPMLKKLDGYQWILTVSCHTLRHVAQMREVQKRLAK